ncbi:hypothetical protein [Sulfurimonas sp.]
MSKTSSRTESRDFQAAVTSTLDCTYSAAGYYDSISANQLADGCEDLLHISDVGETDIEYDKLPFQLEINKFSKKEEEMIEEWLKRNSIKVLDDAKVFHAFIAGLGEKSLFVALPDYEERIRVIKTAIEIAKKNPSDYAEFLSMVDNNIGLYSAAEEIVEAVVLKKIKEKNALIEDAREERKQEERTKKSTQKNATNNFSKKTPLNDGFDKEYEEFLRRKKRREQHRRKILEDKKPKLGVFSSIFNRFF